ncbi:MAG: hypothetical protein KC516_03090 [Nanoarchaeota archaeon]|nr:hypothetical protein [Nanoarchaeota archaeon]
MVGEKGIPKEERRDPKKYYEKGFSESKYLLKERSFPSRGKYAIKENFAKEANRHLEGIKYMEEHGMKVGEMSPYIQGKIAGMIKYGKMSSNKKNVKLAKDLEKSFKGLMTFNQVSPGVSGIERKVAVSIFGISIVIGLTSGVRSFTGAVVGSGSGITSAVGIILFVGGMLGLYLSLKK